MGIICTSVDLPKVFITATVNAYLVSYMSGAPDETSISAFNSPPLFIQNFCVSVVLNRTASLVYL